MPQVFALRRVFESQLNIALIPSPDTFSPGMKHLAFYEDDRVIKDIGNGAAHDVGTRAKLELNAGSKIFRRWPLEWNDIVRTRN